MRVCPYDVFEIRPLEVEDRAGLSFVGRLKAWAHGGKQAYVVKPEACPEEAIRLAPVRG